MTISDLEVDGRNTVNLAAFENTMSIAARRLQASEFSGRYILSKEAVESTSSHTTVSGLTLANYPEIQRFQDSGLQALSRLLDASYIEARLLSGVHASIVTICSLTKVGDLVVSIPPSDGGHFATKGLCKRFGRRHEYLRCDAEMQVAQVEENVKILANASMVFFDQGAPLEPIDLSWIRRITADNAIVVYDASHTLGLICGRRFQQPLIEGAHVLQGNTHKSFPGPIGAVFATNSSQISGLVSDALSECLVSNSSTGRLLALYQSALEMETHAGRYAEQMLKNSTTLANSLRGDGFKLIERSTMASKSHIILIDISDTPRLAKRLIDVGLIINGRELLGVPVIRIGTQEVTRRGMKESYMRILGSLISDIANDRVLTSQAIERVRVISQAHDSVEFCDLTGTASA